MSNSPSLSKDVNATHQNLRLLGSIRLLVLSGQLAALLYAGFILEWQLALVPLLSIWTLFFLLAALTALDLRRRFTVTRRAIFLHLIADSLLLSGMLYFSGGANNPFVSYFLVPICIAAATLHWRQCALIALLCAACYSVLLFYYVPLNAVQHSNMHADHSPTLNLHIIGMWANFIISAAVISFFVVKMARSLRQREAEVHAYRERNLRDEQLLGIATLAAGTAHELGTPLSTIAITLDDMEAAAQEVSAPEKLASIQLLQQQVDSCRASLRKLASKAGQLDQHRITTVAEMVHDLTQQWQLIRPETDIQLEWLRADAKALSILAPSTLQQALLNLLNNAADAIVDTTPVIHLRIEPLSAGDKKARQLRLTIIDDGVGVAREVLAHSGSSNTVPGAIASSKEDGWGIGLMLSHATLQQLGGTVQLFNHEDGGTRTVVTLPLFSAQAT